MEHPARTLTPHAANAVTAASPITAAHPQAASSRLPRAAPLAMPVNMPTNSTAFRRLRAPGSSRYTRVWWAISVTCTPKSNSSAPMASMPSCQLCGAHSQLAVSRAKASVLSAAPQYQTCFCDVSRMAGSPCRCVGTYLKPARRTCKEAVAPSAALR